MFKCCRVTPSMDSDSESADIEKETRMNLVIKLFMHEKSYIASLEAVVLQYLQPIELPDNTGLLIEIFRMVPTILNEHKQFLDELHRRLDSWNALTVVGDAFIATFSKSTLLDAYSTFAYNWYRAKDAICSDVSTFTIPNYELFLSDLVDQTNTDHPDHKLLQGAGVLVRSMSLLIQSEKRNALEFNQRRKHLQHLALQALCLLRNFDKNVVDLLINVSDRQFLSFDLVSILSEPAGCKESGIILFSDLLVLTTKFDSYPPTLPCTSLDTIKFAFLSKIPIADLEVVTTAKDEDAEKGIESLSTEFTKYEEIIDIAASLRSKNCQFGEIVERIRRDIQCQLAEKRMEHTQLNILELAVRTMNQPIQRMSIIFSRPEKRTQWENMLKEIKRGRHQRGEN